MFHSILLNSSFVFIATNMFRHFHAHGCKILLLLGLLCFVAIGNAQPPHPKFFNERFVIKAMSKLHAAQVTYSATVGSGNYGSLEQLKQAGLIDESLAEGQKYLYKFLVTPTASTSGTHATYVATATPVIYRKGGSRSFFIDQTGELRGGDKQGRLATPSDPYIDSCALWGLNNNERCTIQDLRDLHTAQATYRETSGNGNYGTLGTLHALGMIRSDFEDGLSRGYVYVVVKVNVVPPTTPASFYIQATPQTYGVTGIRSFFIDQTGVLRGADKNGAPANENDPPI